MDPARLIRREGFVAEVDTGTGHAVTFDEPESHGGTDTATSPAGILASALVACTIGAGSMIANGAMIMDRVRIGKNCVVGAGTLIPPDKDIPEGSVVMGSPYKIVRETSRYS